MYLPLESDLLRTFLAVVLRQNFTRAAEDVGRTQSAVSMQVKRLEEIVGEPLFQRGARGVVLSSRGEQLVPYARRIVGLVDETSTVMRLKPLDGPVRIGLPEEYGQNVLPRVLAAFAERHPAVEVTVKCGYSRQQMAALERDEVDLAIVFDWSRETIGEVLCIDPTVWVTSLAHSLHEQDPIPVAIYGDSSWCTDFALRSLDQHGHRYRIAYTSDHSGGLKIAVSSGLAITALARSNIPAGCRELNQADGFHQVDSSRVVLRRNPRRSSPAIEGMIEMLRVAFQPSILANQT
ncbi:LysR substrate-binding domain-containing protein [Mesorhizobium sp. CAU 1741]|uniref:LysR family transcriptional regulator n=1 Tax=Mesorhizobium sp. CAU 1741 TaxID=3140366 RepID=UPI00325AA944